MRNLARINNYYNNIECSEEFTRLCAEARRLGIETPILPDKIGWRKLDKINIKLRNQIAATTPPATSEPGAEE